MAEIQRAIRTLAKQIGLGVERAEELVGVFEENEVALEPASKVWLEGFQVTSKSGSFVLVSEDGNERFQVPPSGLDRYFNPNDDETFFALLGLLV